MNKQEIYAFLTAKGLWHEITEHRAVYTMAELSDIAVPYPEADAKTFSCGMIKSRIITSLR